MDVLTKTISLQYIIYIVITIPTISLSPLLASNGFEQPCFHVMLQYPDGKPAIGVKAKVTQIILDSNGNRGRCYPDKNNKHWWQDARLGDSRACGPSEITGKISLKGCEAIPENRNGIRALQSSEQAAYEVRWFSGQVAPDTKIYPIQDFPKTIILKRGVMVTLQCDGSALELVPNVVPLNQATRAATARSESFNGIHTTGQRTWQIVLKEGELYVVGYAQKPQFPSTNSLGKRIAPNVSLRDIYLNHL